MASAQYASIRFKAICVPHNARSMPTQYKHTTSKATGFTGLLNGFISNASEISRSSKRTKNSCPAEWVEYQGVSVFSAKPDTVK